MVGPHRRVAEALGPRVRLDACCLTQLPGPRHQGNGLQHIKAADGAAGQMHLCPALPGGLLHLCVEIQIRKGSNGNDHKVDSPAQHRDGHGTDRLHRSRLYNVLRLQCQQLFHIRTGLAAYVGSGLLAGSRGTAGDTHQLIILQQTVFPGVCHDIAQETAAHDAKFRFHVRFSFSVPAQWPYHI